MKKNSLCSTSKQVVRLEWSTGESTMDKNHGYPTPPTRNHTAFAGISEL